MKKITVTAAVGQMDAIIDFVNAELESVDCSMGVQAQVDIAIDEIFSNIVHYAYDKQGEPGTVDVYCEISDSHVEIVVCDSGVPYNPLEKADPDVTLSVEEREIGGLGIFMVKKTMDEMIYEHKDGQNVLTIRKRL